MDPKNMDTHGLIALFKALNTPCECEKGVIRDEHGKRLKECQDDPLPYPGYRWYREMVEPSLSRPQIRKIPFRGPALRDRVRVAA